MMVFSSAVPKPWVSVATTRSDRKKTCPIWGRSATKSSTTTPTTRTAYWISRRRLARWRGDGPRRTGGARVETLIAKTFLKWA